MGDLPTSVTDDPGRQLVHPPGTPDSGLILVAVLCVWDAVAVVVVVVRVRDAVMVVWGGMVTFYSKLGLDLGGWHCVCV